MEAVTRTGKRRGLAAVEAALVLPVFVLLVFGLLEYGWMFMKVQQVQGAARSGVRAGVRQGATNADVLNAITTTMANGGLSGSGYTWTATPPNVAVVLPGAAIAVSVTVPYQNGIWLTHIPFIPVPGNLVGTATMAKEGPP
jgi:TadE-like protein